MEYEFPAENENLNNIFSDEKIYRKEVRKKRGLFDSFWVQVGLSMVLVICILVLNIIESDYAAALCEKFVFEMNRESNLFTEAYSYTLDLFV
ncbi:MAG: hypothetical protein LBL93_02895 [Ruminococcus sp.]|jgi:hypothetical protein|nr:hypothetical protein [Ruminococcus sp.]